MPLIYEAGAGGRGEIVGGCGARQGVPKKRTEAPPSDKYLALVLVLTLIVLGMRHQASIKSFWQSTNIRSQGIGKRPPPRETRPKKFLKNGM